MKILVVICVKLTNFLEIYKINIYLDFLKNGCLDSKNILEAACGSFEYGFCLAMQYRDVLEMEEKFKTTA